MPASGKPPPPGNNPGHYLQADAPVIIRIVQRYRCAKGLAAGALLAATISAQKTAKADSSVVSVNQFTFRVRFPGGQSITGHDQTSSLDSSCPSPILSKKMCGRGLYPTDESVGCSDSASRARRQSKSTCMHVLEGLRSSRTRTGRAVLFLLLFRFSFFDLSSFDLSSSSRTSGAGLSSRTSSRSRCLISR